MTESHGGSAAGTAGGGRLSRYSCMAVAASAAAVAAVAAVNLGWTPPNLALVLVLVVAPLAVAGTALAMLRRPAGQRRNFLLACASAVIGLYLLEALFAASPRLAIGLARGFGAWDTRSKLRVIADLRAEGKDAMSAFFPYSFARQGRSMTIGGVRTMPLSSVAKVTTVVCNEGGEWLVYDSDEHGFNNPKGLWKDLPLDILAVGDSFTHGYCVRREDHFVARLRRNYPRSVTVGMGGNGPVIELASLIEYGAVARPRLVLWSYFERDAVQGMAERRHPILARYFDEPGFRQDVFRRQKDIDAILRRQFDAAFERALAGERRKTWAAEATALAGLRRLRHALRLDTVTPEMPGQSAPRRRPTAVQLAVLREVLARAKDVAGTWGGRLVFVYLPSWRSVMREREAADADRAMVTAVPIRLGIPVVDVQRAFLRHEELDSLFYFPGSHYNEKGYRVVAEAILAARAVRRALDGRERKP